MPIIDDFPGKVYEMNRLEEYLKSDRQWLREHRLAHAKLQLSNAQDLEEKEFWQKVIEANTL